MMGRCSTPGSLHSIRLSCACTSTKASRLVVLQFFNMPSQPGSGLPQTLSMKRPQSAPQNATALYPAIASCPWGQPWPRPCLPLHLPHLTACHPTACLQICLIRCQSSFPPPCLQACPQPFCRPEAWPPSSCRSCARPCQRWPGLAAAGAAACGCLLRGAPPPCRGPPGLRCCAESAPELCCGWGGMRLTRLSWVGWQQASRGRCKDRVLPNQAEQATSKSVVSGFLGQMGGARWDTWQHACRWRTCAAACDDVVHKCARALAFSTASLGHGRELASLGSHGPLISLLVWQALVVLAHGGSGDAGLPRCLPLLRHHKRAAQDVVQRLQVTCMLRRLPAEHGQLKAGADETALTGWQCRTGKRKMSVVPQHRCTSDVIC